MLMTRDWGVLRAQAEALLNKNLEAATKSLGMCPHPAIASSFVEREVDFDFDLDFDFEYDKDIYHIIIKYLLFIEKKIFYLYFYLFVI